MVMVMVVLTSAEPETKFSFAAITGFHSLFIVFKLKIK
jgi:hypothetical protein